MYRPTLIESPFHVLKILKKVEYESAGRKKNVKEKQEKERNKSQHSLLSVRKGAQGNSRELKGTQGNSRELKGTHLKSFHTIELKGTQKKTMLDTYHNYIFDYDSIIQTYS